MDLITLEHLSKEFKVLNRREGLRGSIKDLFSRDYGYVSAVNDLSLQVEEGEIVGFLGPNGAGKSTTIKMMTGVMFPTSGMVQIGGIDPFKKRREFSKNVGVVFGQRSQLWWELPVIESFRLLKEVYRISDEEYKKNMQMFDEIVDIQKFLHTPVKNLSLGQRMLCEIIGALIHSPKLLFLDEPTIGLDVVIKSKIRDLIKNLNQRQKITVILTSHDIGDVDALCKRIAIIDHGSLIYDGNIERVKAIYGGYRTLKAKLEDGQSIEEFMQKINNKFGEGVYISEGDERWVNVEVFIGKVEALQVMNYIMEAGNIKDIKSEDISTESIVKKIYEGNEQ